MPYWYHCVIRPRLEALPTLQEMQSCLRDLKGINKFVLSCEKGSSKGEEEYNHFDLVIVMEKNLRVDSLKRTLCDRLDIPKDNRRNCKVFAIDEDRMSYQIGYSLKEGRDHVVYGFDKFEVADGLAKYEEVGPMKPEKFSEEAWNIDDIYKQFRDFLCRLHDDGRARCNDAISYKRSFIRENRKFIRGSVYSKFKEEVMMDLYCDD